MWVLFLSLNFKDDRKDVVTLLEIPTPGVRVRVHELIM